MPEYRYPDLKVDDEMHPPGNVVNGSGKLVKMKVLRIDTNPAMSAKVKQAQGVDVRYVECSYVLHDVEHVEEFREDSLRHPSEVK